MAPRSEARGPSKTIGYRRSRAQIPDELKLDGRQRREPTPAGGEIVTAAAQLNPPDRRSSANYLHGLHQLAKQSRRQPRTATAGGSQKPGQDRQYPMLSMAQRPHNATRVPRISGHFTKVSTNMLAIHRPRTPCRPAGAWAMFLTNSCYKNDIGYNYAIISYFRVPEP